MSKKLTDVAKSLYDNSTSLRTVAAPTAVGFKAVQAWLYDREETLAEVHGISRKEIYSLTFEVNKLASSVKRGGSLSLTD